MAPKKPRSPQQKKALSLQKDRRNGYGENDKGSRKTIPAAKARGHRIARHTDKQALGDVAAAVEQVPLTLRKPAWKKSADVPLGEVITSSLAKRVRLVGRRANKRKPDPQA
jgi:hypothetical protein